MYVYICIEREKLDSLFDFILDKHSYSERREYFAEKINGKLYDV